jgi:hypothetical protein
MGSFVQVMFSYLSLVCFNLPSQIPSAFKNIVYEFLWKGKKDPVKRSVLSNDYLEGG